MSNSPQRPDGSDDDKTTPDARQGARSVDGVQGEGDYESARRYQKDTERFIEEGKVPDAAKRARPEDAQEARSLEQAEEAGRERSQGEDVHDRFAQRKSSRDRQH